MKKSVIFVALFSLALATTSCKKTSETTTEETTVTTMEEKVDSVAIDSTDIGEVAPMDQEKDSITPQK